jgi:hypothetical protein
MGESVVDLESCKQASSRNAWNEYKKRDLFHPLKCSWTILKYKKEI